MWFVQHSFSFRIGVLPNESSTWFNLPVSMKNIIESLLGIMLNLCPFIGHEFSMHMGAHKRLQFHFQGIWWPPWPLNAWGAMWCINKHPMKTCVHNLLKNWKDIFIYVISFVSKYSLYINRKHKWYKRKTCKQERPTGIPLEYHKIIVNLANKQHRWY